MELHIPENMPVGNIPIKVVKYEPKQSNITPNKQTNKVRFDESTIKPQQQPITQQQPIKPSLSNVKRPQMPEPKPRISYDDILGKMGMFVADGQLHLLDGKPQKQVQQIQQAINKNTNTTNTNTNTVKQVQLDKPIDPAQNSYIYNKYFNNEVTTNPSVRKPQTIQEYRDMLIHDIIQKHKVKQIKSTKLIMPTSNINFAQGRGGNLNRLFSFSQR